jgi:putative ABC transport system permease protein
MRAWLTSISLKLRAFTKSKQLDRDLDDELAFHLAKRERQNRDAGMDAEEAHYAARRQFGNANSIKERSRANWTFGTLETVWQDMRFGARMLRRNPGFTSVAALTLALGIGANTAIFSIVNAVLLRPLPYPQSERIVQIGLQATDGFIPDVTVPQFGFLRDHGASAFDSVAAFQGWSTLELKQQDRIDWLKGLRVSSDFFRTLAVSPVLGREFTDTETQRGSALSIILSDAVWRNILGAGPDIIGTRLKLNDDVYTVVGVLPPDFIFFENPVDAYIPLRPSGSMGDSGFNTSAIARLKPHVNLSQAQIQMAILFPQLPNKQDHLLGLAVVSYQHLLTGDIRPSLLVLFGAVGLLLLIACVNVASLMLARTHTRTREISIRLALGAGRARLISQLLAESLLMTVIGACAGLLLAYWSLNALLSAVPWDLHAPADAVRLDRTVLGFTLIITILTSVTFGLVSFWQSRRMNVVNAIKEGQTQGAATAAHGRIRDILVVSETALSLMLLVGAALLAETVYRLHQEKLGFDPTNVVKMSVAYPDVSGYSGQRLWTLQKQLLTRIQALPGVQSAAAVAVAPLAGKWNMPAQLLAYNDAEHSIGGMEIRTISDGYFETMRILVRQGRGIVASDGASAPPVVVINETVARRWWKNRSPIGDHIVIGQFMGRKFFQGAPIAREVVGIATDVKGILLTQPAPPMVYIPAAQAQDMDSAKDFVIRAARGLDLGLALRQVVSAVDPELRITDLRTMSELISTSIASQRFDALLMVLFSSVALALASVGIYGVLSLYVQQRTHEIGVRMALGAEQRQVVRLVLKQGLVLVAIGVCIGLMAAFGLTRFLSGLLYGVRSTNIAPYAVGSFVLVAVALLASYLPARRAMRVDPMVALRYE